MNKISQLLLIAFITFAAHLSAQNEIKLNLEVGKTYTIHQETKNVTNQTMNGMAQDVTMTVTAKTDYMVTGMNGKNYLIDITPVTSKTEQMSGGMTMTMDSEGDLSDPMNQIMNNLTGNVMKMEITPHGEVIEFNSNGYIKNMMKGVEMPATAISQLEAQLAGEYDDAALKESYLQLLSIYPKKKKKKGELWTTEFTVDVVMPVSSTATNTLMDVTSESYVIKSEADISTDPSKSTEMMGMEAKSDLKGKSIATYTLDKKTGWISKATMTQDMDGTLTIAASAQMPQEMKVKMKVQSTTEIK